MGGEAGRGQLCPDASPVVFMSRSSPGGERGLLGKYCSLFRDLTPLERRVGVFE